jgi:hypothetical protein
MTLVVCALKLSTHLLRLMRLRRRSQDDERQDDKDAISPSDYPIANSSNRYEPVTPTSWQDADRA